MKCPVCGTSLPPNESACPKCGKRFGQASPAGRQTGPYNQPASSPAGNQAAGKYGRNPQANYPGGNRSGNPAYPGSGQPNYPNQNPKFAGVASQPAYPGRQQNNQPAYPGINAQAGRWKQGKTVSKSSAVSKTSKIVLYAGAAFSVILAFLWILPVYGYGFSFFEAMKAGSAQTGIGIPVLNLTLLMGVCFLSAGAAVFAAIKGGPKLKWFAALLLIPALAGIVLNIMMMSTINQTGTALAGSPGFGVYGGIVLSVLLIGAAGWILLTKQKASKPLYDRYAG